MRNKQIVDIGTLPDGVFPNDSYRVYIYTRTNGQLYIYQDGKEKCTSDSSLNDGFIPVLLTGHFPTLPDINTVKLFYWGRVLMELFHDGFYRAALDSFNLLDNTVSGNLVMNQDGILSDVGISVAQLVTIVNNYDSELVGIDEKIQAIYDDEITRIDGNILALEDKVDANDLAINDKVDTLAASLTGLYKYKGVVADKIALEAIVAPELGDTYNVTEYDTGTEILDNHNFAWNGLAWDDIGGTDRLATLTNDGLLSSSDFAKLAALDVVKLAKVDIPTGAAVNFDTELDNDVPITLDNSKRLTLANAINTYCKWIENVKFYIQYPTATALSVKGWLNLINTEIWGTGHGVTVSRIDNLETSVTELSNTVSTLNNIKIKQSIITPIPGANNEITISLVGYDISGLYASVQLTLEYNGIIPDPVTSYKAWVKSRTSDSITIGYVISTGMTINFLAISTS